jgi:hypothetical protein
MTGNTGHIEKAATGGFVTLDGERYYRISSYHLLSPFFMNIANDTDLWMFVSSSGGLTAGRVDADGALFPYETVDKLHVSNHHTGPVTLIRKEGEWRHWIPFTQSSVEDFDVERNIYKNVTGSKVIFEEINNDLGLSFRYRWAGSDKFGHVRTAVLENTGKDKASLTVLDGLRNVIPYGAALPLYQQLSSLVDAYKRVDVDPGSKMAIFSLTSKIIDRAEAAESLRANAVWCDYSSPFEVCLSTDTVVTFRRGKDPAAETLLTGQKGNYFVKMRFDAEPGAVEKWHIAADSGKSHAELSALRDMIAGSGSLDGEIEKSIAEAGAALERNVGSADGLQLTGYEEASAHHFANVLFNNMRGGVFADSYAVGSSDLAGFIRLRNKRTAERAKGFLSGLPERLDVKELNDKAAGQGEPDLERLCHEYLPIFFGRRHGDPSRPWNRFSIHLKDRDGGRLLRYEGNWRDIFQNWEALCASYPGFLPSVTAKFVNASTVDGFNPYRITREGIDWEISDPDDPWSYIGYWGDHQIIYLLKFLESLVRYYPGALEGMLAREIFSYADVPYRIKPYEDILADPDSTIEYDHYRAELIDARVESIGTDGRLLHDSGGTVYHVNLLEKLLVPVLSKVSNLVPDGGIWMNTQRPEWNDANNALVGNGISMVTLSYLRRHVDFLAGLLEGIDDAAMPVSSEVAEWLSTLDSVLGSARGLLGSGPMDDSDRKRVLDMLGRAFSEYRAKVYAKGFSGKKTVRTGKVAGFFRTVLVWLDHAIEQNRRDDGLYHAYNLLEISKDGESAAVKHLYEMLEGQVAVLSSGEVPPAEAADLLEALFDSPMFREDQRSFMLYPKRELPAFLEKNAVPADGVRAVELLRELLEEGDESVISLDSSGVYRFNSDFANAADLGAALDRLAAKERWASLVINDREVVLDLFEDVFDHRSFTGRSGTMYGYEGLGCIYWHMVSKLLLATQEAALRVSLEEGQEELFDRLASLYLKIRSGLSFEKPVPEYGAFPTDPYSHTPPHSGAQQPGMTGQVKEEILTRLGELGVAVENGILGFRPVLLEKKEFLAEPGTFRYYAPDGQEKTLEVPAGSLAFTFCQVPVVYELSDGRWIRVSSNDGETRSEGGSLDAETSRAVFDRLGRVNLITVGIPEDTLR